MSPTSSAAQRSLPLALLLALSYCLRASAHSWIDCFDTDRSKIYDQSASYIFGGAGGNGFCEGYGAGYPGRGDIDIGTEYTYKMLLNEVEAGAPVCQNVGDNTYSDWRKRISVAPGTQIYYAYLPNGHIVKDKKGIGTQHGIYWTGVPGTSLSTTKDMTADNLIDGVTLDYDDGNCGETLDFNGNPGGRAGDGKPCIGHFTVPSGTAAGIYKMVWYWTFYRPDGEYVDATLAKGYFGASYSTCFEVEVTGSGGSAPAAPTIVKADAPASKADLLIKSDAPAVTTAAPAVTTAAPAVTTAAPAATTAAPALITAAPAVTTAAPAATTAAPAVTTAAPVATPAATSTAHAATPATTIRAPAATPATTTAASAAAAHTPGATPATTTATSAAAAHTPGATPASTAFSPASTPAATTLSGSASSGKGYSFSSVNSTGAGGVGVVHAKGDSSTGTRSASTEDAKQSSSSRESVSILTEASSAVRSSCAGNWSALLVAATSIAVWLGGLN